jgi:hypothetical protein
MLVDTVCIGANIFDGLAVIYTACQALLRTGKGEMVSGKGNIVFKESYSRIIFHVTPISAISGFGNTESGSSKQWQS